MDKAAKEKDAENAILEMVGDGQACAKVSRKTMTVDFLDDEEVEQKKALELICAIEKQNVRIVELANKQYKMNRDIKLNPAYISKSLEGDNPHQDHERMDDY